MNAETADLDEIIKQLRIAYECNRPDYTGRYPVAVRILCKKYGVRIAEMNRMIAEDPVVAKEVYAVMDAEFEKNVRRWKMKLYNMRRRNNQS